MSKRPYLLSDASIVNEGEVFVGSILIDQGKIKKIFRGDVPEGLSENIKVIGLAGKVLLPGIIDDQVHFREPGLTHKGDIASESRAAVAGGITSYMEMPNTLPQTVSQKELENKVSVALEASLANFSFYIGATNDNIDEIVATDVRWTCGVKVFMGSSTGNMLVDNPESLTTIFRKARLPVAVHCEDEDIIRRNLEEAKKRFGENIPVHFHPQIRSRQACFSSSSKAVELALKHGTRLHLLHLSTSDELQLLENSTPLVSKQITAEACVHHLWFFDQDYETRGSFIKWNPAIKSLSDRQSLREAIRNGTIDVVATDHAPHTIEEKNNPYLQCPSGGPMVQHSLLAMLELVNQNVISITRLVDLMCHNPATCFKVSNRGFVREGYAADLVVVNTNSPQTVTPGNILYKCGWSPLENQTFKSKVVYTFVNGNMVFENGKLNDDHKGHLLQFDN